MILRRAAATRHRQRVRGAPERPIPVTGSQIASTFPRHHRRGEWGVNQLSLLARVG